jgi:hypothetical protein
MDQEQFLSECGKSYPEAFAALAYFRQSIQQRCKPVVQKRIQEFANVLGIPVKELRVIGYAEPDKLGAAVSDVIYLGVQAKPSEELYLYFCLRWNRKPDVTPLRLVISIWPNNAQKRVRIPRVQLAFDW